MSILDQTYSFKNKELLTITKNADTVLYSRQAKYKQANCSGTGAQGTGQPMIFTYFPSSSPSKFS